MDGYYEAVSLCVKNDSTDWCRQWTRVADIVDGQLCVCSFNDDWQEFVKEQKKIYMQDAHLRCQTELNKRDRHREWDVIEGSCCAAEP